MQRFSKAVEVPKINLGLEAYNREDTVRRAGHIVKEAYPERTTCPDVARSITNLLDHKMHLNIFVYESMAILCSFISIVTAPDMHTPLTT